MPVLRDHTGYRMNGDLSAYTGLAIFGMLGWLLIVGVLVWVYTRRK